MSTQEIIFEYKDIKVIKYTEKSIAVIGETANYKELLKKIGGKYNARLKCGPGWIFSAKKSDDIKKSFTGLSDDYKETPTINTSCKVHSMDVLFERQQMILKKLDQILFLLPNKKSGDHSEVETEEKPKKLLRKKNY
jgi:hypothetical protein